MKVSPSNESPLPTALLGVVIMLVAPTGIWHVIGMIVAALFGGIFAVTLLLVAGSYLLEKRS